MASKKFEKNQLDNMRKNIIGIVLIATVLLYGFKEKDRAFSIAKNMDIFTSLFKEVSQHYVDDVNSNLLMNKGLKSSLASLDPYTVYIPEDKIEDYRIENDGQYVGIGALTSKILEEHYVQMVYKGYPAEEAGLRIGDKVVSIGGTAIKGKSDDQIRKIVKGQENTTVILVVERYGEEEPIEIEINRKKVEINSVSYKGVLEDSIGYVRLSQFSANCGQQVEEALRHVLDSGATRVVLDLRGNPGGFLHEAVNVCNLFIPKDVKVVETKGKNPIYSKTYVTLNAPMDTNIPIAVLINKKSASASEIVSGVIQDYDRGVLIGERSFGKGLVQKTWPLPYKSQLKATISKYYIPSGRCIQALDYNKRSKDGKATKVADSLKNTFYTQGGRKVFDGGGVSPDRLVSGKTERTDFLKYLLNNGFITKYANKYVFEHPDAPEIEGFELLDTDYQDFASWLEEREFYYNSPAVIITDTIQASVKEKDGELAKELGIIQDKMRNATEKFLSRDKEIISEEIAEEVIKRYYLQEGETIYSLARDQQLVTAMAVLRDTKEYDSLLLKQN